VSQDEFGAALVVDADTQNIARQEITRKLHAAKLTSHCLCQGSRKRRLADAGNVLDEQMPAGEKCDQGKLDGLVLPLEGALHRLS